MKTNFERVFLLNQIYRLCKLAKLTCKALTKLSSSSASMARTGRVLRGVHKP